MSPKEGLLARFVNLDDFLGALSGLKKERWVIENVYTPFKIREAQEIMAPSPSPARLFTFAGGVLGGLGVLGLAVYSHLSFSLITGGKPVLPWIPWVVVCFEGTILGAVLAAVASWVFLGRMPRLTPVTGYDPSFSADRFGILVACTPEEEDRIREFFAEAGAEEVRHLTW